MWSLHSPFVNRITNFTQHNFVFTRRLLRNAKQRTATLLPYNIITLCWTLASSISFLRFPFNFSRLCAGLRIVYGVFRVVILPIYCVFMCIALLYRLFIMWILRKHFTEKGIFSQVAVYLCRAGPCCATELYVWCLHKNKCIYRFSVSIYGLCGFIFIILYKFHT